MSRQRRSGAGPGKNPGKNRSQRARSPRRRQPQQARDADVPELDADRILSGIGRVERTGDSEWFVRTVGANAAVKNYTCPGCGGQIAPGTVHLVVWRNDWMLGEADAIAERRHWHTACWRKRSFRTR